MGLIQRKCKYYLKQTKSGSIFLEVEKRLNLKGACNVKLSEKISAFVMLLNAVAQVRHSYRIKKIRIQGKRYLFFYNYVGGYNNIITFAARNLNPLILN